MLGMPIWVAHKWSMSFMQPVFHMDRRPTDRHGRLPLSITHVTMSGVVQLRTETNIQCQVTTRKNFCPISLIEGQSGSLPLSTNPNQSEKNCRMADRCLILTGQPLEFSTGCMIGTFNGSWSRPDRWPPARTGKQRGEVGRTLPKMSWCRDTYSHCITQTRETVTHLKNPTSQQ